MVTVFFLENQVHFPAVTTDTTYSSVAQSASHSMDARGLFPELKLQGRKSNHLPPLGPRVRVHISIPPFSHVSFYA